MISDSTKEKLMKVLPAVLLLAAVLPGCRSSLSPSPAALPVFGQTLPATFTGEKDAELMVLVPAGYFLMGSEEESDDEKPVHRVFLDAFYIDTAEVSCARYERFLRDTGHPPHQLWDPEHDRPEDPVVGVSWYDAAAFAKWAGKRLPTEAEWEKAGRGGLVGKRYPWGDDIDRERANYSSFGTTPVKSYDPNGYGIYDMAGNVWEWCNDWYAVDYYTRSPERNPAGPVRGEKKVVRGGAWYTGETALRIANRFRNDPSLGNFNTGFRCAKSVMLPAHSAVHPGH